MPERKKLLGADERVRTGGIGTLADALIYLP